MGGTTAALTLPYPTGTDLVSDGDNAMQSLAETVEGRLQIGACGYLNTTIIGVGGGVLIGTEMADPLGMYAAGVFKALRKGIYLATATCMVGNGGTGTSRLITVETRTPPAAFAEVARVGMPIQSTLYLGLSISVHRLMAVNDELRFFLYHDSTGGMTISQIHVGMSLVCGLA